MLIPGPCGQLEISFQAPDQPAPVATVAVICHPHPVYGGTMDNKVVTTLARACLAQGMAVVRFNFRGVGRSDGSYDEAVGEIDDALAVADWARAHTQAASWWLAGFSFGAYVACAAAERLQDKPAGQSLVGTLLVAPAVDSYPMPAPRQPEQLELITAGADEVVDTAAAVAWAAASGVHQQTIADASHFFDGRLPLLQQTATAAMTAISQRRFATLNAQNGQRTPNPSTTDTPHD